MYRLYGIRTMYHSLRGMIVIENIILAKYYQFQVAREEIATHMKNISFLNILCNIGY